MVKNLFLWLIIALVIIYAVEAVNEADSVAQENNYVAFKKQLAGGDISSVKIDGKVITGMRRDGRQFSVVLPLTDPELLPKLEEMNVETTGVKPQEPSILMSILISWFPMLLLIGVWVFYLRAAQGGGHGALGFSKSKAKLMSESDVKTTFADVAGCDEAKEEVKEVVDYLRDPSKYRKLGGKIPRGVLLVGQPGTGKTLLAKAISGEAKVPFYSISGSDFVEMFVGVGASRVRDMFATAKKHAPCIIFIDEIDAVGRKRSAGFVGGQDEREQTLNQLLVEMDGFEGHEAVIVIAATNRPDVLDSALLRPGRFDRQVTVALPDIKGREQILAVHMRKVPTSGDVNVALIARGTPGFSGAELANLVNEAALNAARTDKRMVTMADFDFAKDKLLMGTARRSMAMNEHEKENTAYHESGHAIVGKLVPDHDPVYKVSIIPRGRALGVTMYLPENDRFSHSRQYLESMIASLYAGRIAEELIFGNELATTGAANDIEKATGIARNMVLRWGFSSKLGAQLLENDQMESYYGGGSSQLQGMSESTRELIDSEIRDILNRNYNRARTILEENMDILHAMKDALMKYETIDADQIEDLMARRPVRDIAAAGAAGEGKPGDGKPEAEPVKAVSPEGEKAEQTDSRDNSPRV